MATDVLPPSNGSVRAVATRKSRVEKVLRERDVVALVVAGGYSDEEIAALLTERYEAEGRPKITRRQVTNARNRALERYAPSEQQVETVRGQQLQTLDELKTSIMPKALDGQVRAVETVLRIESFRADLVGTKAPRKLEHGGQISHVHELADPDEVARLEEAFHTSVAYDVDGTADELPELEPGDD